ncbi:MAG: O-antigen ligase family protein [bacterium]
MTATTAKDAVRSTGIVLLVVPPLLAVLLLLNPSPAALVVLLLFLLLLPLLLLNDAWALFLLLLLRPAIDVFGEHTLVMVRQVPFNLASIFSIIVIVWGILRLFHYRSALWRRPLFWPWILVLLAALPGFAATTSLTATLREYARLLSIAVLYLVAFDILRSPGRLRRFVAVFFASLLVPAAVAIVQFFTQTGLTVGDIANRLFGTFGHPNVFAFYLVLSAAVLIAFLPQFSRTWRRWGVLGLLLLLGFLAATYTRGAWIGAGIVLALFGAVYYRKAFLWIVAVTLVIAFLGPMLNRFTVSTVNLDLRHVPVLSRVLNQNAENNSLDWRTELWKEMWPKVAERPIVGYGLGMFPILREQQISHYDEGTEAHNDYLRLAVESGFLGLAAYAFLLLALLRQAVLQLRRAVTTEQRRVALGVLALGLSFAFMSFFDNMLQATAVMWALWATIAAMLSFGRESSTVSGALGET